jgi:squalene synthase HpnC
MLVKQRGGPERDPIVMIRAVRGNRDVDGLGLTRAAQRSVLDQLAAGTRTQMGAENFPVALRLVPRAPRAYLMHLYDFARFVDDVGDTATGDRLALLDLVEADVHAIGAGTATLPPVRAVGDLMARYDLGPQPFLDLIEANRVDQIVHRYADFADLLGYCRLSAAPVGRVVLAVAGAATPQNIADSDSVCAALQVLEHCQDVGEDAAQGRIYLPASELHAAGIDEPSLLVSSTSGRLRSVVSVQVERALAMLSPGTALVRRLSGWSRVAVAGGLATAAALRDADYDVLAAPVTPRNWPTAVQAIRLLAGRR